jgi:hypothetical protein
MLAGRTVQNDVLPQTKRHRIRLTDGEFLDLARFGTRTVQHSGLRMSIAWRDNE